jgi:hypothetical protein
VQALIPDVERGAVLAIRDKESDHWTSAARANAPRIASFDANVIDNRLAVEWAVEADTTTAEVWIQWSADHGDVWNALAAGLTGGSSLFDCSHLPAGTVTLRLLASDGFDTEISTHVDVQLPRRPPAVSILAPTKDEVLLAGGTLRLWGAVTVDGRPSVAVEEARWLLDGEQIAEGLDAFRRAPSAGEHILELRVTADALEGSVAHGFVTVSIEGRKR